MAGPSDPSSSFAAFAVGKPDARFSDWLRARAGPLWDGMVEHRFTREIAADALPPGVFERYLRAEHGFVRTAVRMFAHALARAPTPGDQRHLAGILEALTGEQERYFRETFARLGRPAEPTDATPADAVLALGEGALAVAADGTFEEILCTMLAAEWAYLTWCERAHAAAPTNSEAARWITLHVGVPFAEGVAWTRARVDTLGPLLDAARQEACAHHFRRMLALEIAFHDAPYAAAL